MPFAGFTTFQDCVDHHINRGHDTESARRICGKLQSDVEGSSSQTSGGNYDNKNMSFPPEQKKEESPDNGNGGKVELSTEDAATVAQFVVDAASVIEQSDAPEEVKTEAAAALAIIEKEFKVEEVPA